MSTSRLEETGVRHRAHHRRCPRPQHHAHPDPDRPHQQQHTLNLRWPWPSPSQLRGWHARPGKETADRELAQQLESPSGTGRVDPVFITACTPRRTPRGYSHWTNPFSLGNLCALQAWGGRAHQGRAARWDHFDTRSTSRSTAAVITRQAPPRTRSRCASGPLRCNELDALLLGRVTYEMIESAWRQPATGTWPD